MPYSGIAMPRRRNATLWIGFAVVVLSLASYIPIFTLFPVTRDVPWANYLLFLVGGGLLGVGLRRALREPERYRGQVSGPILGVLALLAIGFFCFTVLYFSKQIPSAAGALRVG